MALHREVLEDRFNYTWETEPIYVQIHDTTATWIPGEVEPEEASQTGILSERLLGVVAGAYNTVTDTLDFTLDATYNNTSGSSVNFNRITIWRGTGADVGNLGDGTVGNSGLEITLATAPPVGLVNGSRVLLSNGTDYLQATANTVAGTLLTLSTTVGGTFTDGTTVKVAGGIGIFVGTSQLSFNAVVNDGQTVALQITGSNLLQ